MRASHIFALAAALAGQVYATVNVTVGTQNMTASDLLNFGPSASFVSTANCGTSCGNATTQMAICGDDDTCICSNSTGSALLNCEQCLFNYIVDKNINPSNPLLGSQPALSAFIAGCLAPPHNTTIQALKMTPPPSWDGPQANKLGLGATVVAVAAGAVLGSGSLFLLATIE